MTAFSVTADSSFVLKGVAVGISGIGTTIRFQVSVESNVGKFLTTSTNHEKTVVRLRATSLNYHKYDRQFHMLLHKINTFSCCEIHFLKRFNRKSRAT
jgi:hypothetical protein